MTYEELEKMMGETRFFDYGKHELLVNLSTVFDCKNPHDGYEYQTEVTFAVPINWLCDYKEKENGRVWDFGDVDDWLCNKYTSEDSQPILEKAIEENKVAFWKIN